MKDVSHAALKDLIQFMYCGEVNVKQDALPAFISTAEALQIKGLTESGENVPPQQTTVVQAQPVTKETTRITTVPVQTTHVAARPISRQVKARPATATYKLESEESSDEKIIHSTQVPQTIKRVQKSITPQSAPASKRIKITTTADPLETIEPTQIAIQEKEDEFINLPIETLNPKAEPRDYGDDSGPNVSEIETTEGDNTPYVEDETYGDMAKYEESYFAEGDDSGKVGQSTFGESYSATEQQGQTQEAQG